MCKVEGCPGDHKARGYCTLHYQRVQKYGDPNISGITGRPRKVTNKTYREPPEHLRPLIRAMVQDRRHRGIPAEGVLMAGEQPVTPLQETA